MKGEYWFFRLIVLFYFHKSTVVPFSPYNDTVKQQGQISAISKITVLLNYRNIRSNKSFTMNLGGLTLSGVQSIHQTFTDTHRKAIFPSSTPTSTCNKPKFTAQLICLVLRRFPVSGMALKKQLLELPPPTSGLQLHKMNKLFPSLRWTTHFPAVQPARKANNVIHRKQNPINWNCCCIPTQEASLATSQPPPKANLNLKQCVLQSL